MGVLKKIEVIDIPLPKAKEDKNVVNVIIGHSHFIKSVEDIYEALITSAPNIKFGLAFIEASGKRLVRVEGNDEELKKLASEVALKIGAGHTFIIYLRNAWPINVLNALKLTQEVTRIYTATANPVQVVIAETDQGRAVLGVVDGFTPLGVEGPEDIEERKRFLREIGYKR